MEHRLTKSNDRKNYGRVFLLALLIAACAWLPFVIYNKGLFLYYGDFNVQQIPFYQLAHDAVRSGSWRWNWYTDLGANFIGSYSFYLLFSPFFWLTVPLPTAWLPYMMAPLLVLKSACAATTAYAYIRRFMRDLPLAVFVSLLYAFSGFSVYNIFFNHFHEAIVFFPLLLIGLEKAMTENKVGYFAGAIAINAVVNYWFFIGEAVFVAVYFFVRLTSPDWKLTGRKFLRIALEVILGMGIAMAAFLPSVLAIMGNPRTTSDNFLNGTALWYYSNPQRYLGILHSFFFCPDMPALNNMFPDHGAQWSSLAAYLPLFGAAGVIGFYSVGKRNWLRRMLTVCAVMALVPMFNHLFVLLNNSYYTRWFYMPTLLCVLATGVTLERTLADPDFGGMERGLKVSGVVIGIILLMVGFTPKRVDGEWQFGTYRWVYLFLGTSLITVLGYAASVWLMRRARFGRNFRQKLYASIMAACFLFTFGCMLIGKISYPDTSWITENALPARNQMSMSAEGVYERCDIYEGDDNLGMYWNIPNIQCFHSIVPVSLMEFYPDVGIKRDVSSKPSTNYYALRNVLSVRWLYVSEDSEEQMPMQGYEYRTNRYGYNIYENTNYIPMGFAYDNYMTVEDWDQLSGELKTRAMTAAVYLDADAISRNSDILSPMPDNWKGYLTYDDCCENSAVRRSEACDSFTVTNAGFEAETSYDRDRLVFFSVPYDKGWSAEVNGEPAEIYKASVGFMCVRVPAGQSHIAFSYTAPGLKIGVCVSAVSLLGLALFILLARRKGLLMDRRVPAAKAAQTLPENDSAPEGETPAPEDEAPSPETPKE